MKKVFKVPAIAAMVVGSASVSAWWGNNGYYGYAPYGYAPYGYIAPAMTEEQQKQAAEQYAQAIEAQRKAAEAFAQQQAEAYKQFTANMPAAPQARSGFPGFQRPGFQSREEAIKEMEARRAEIHRRHPVQRSHDRAERIKEMEARHAERKKKMEARRAKMQEEMEARRAEFFPDLN
jgi:hypothetical protein